MHTLITTTESAAKALIPVLIFILGQWTARAQKRRDSEKEALATLRKDYEALLSALVAFRFERNAHNKVRVGWKARVFMGAWAAYEWLLAFDYEAEDRITAAIRATGPGMRRLGDWRQRVDEQEWRITGPLNDVCRAGVPLVGSKFGAVSSAAGKVLDLLTSDDDKAMDAAIGELHQAVVDAEATQKKRRIWLRGRSRPALESAPEKRPVIES